MTHPTPTDGDADADLVRRVQGGELDQFATLMQRHNRRVYRVARGMSVSDAEAEDVMQETYLRAYSGLASFEGRARFSTWLTRIAVHTAAERRRRTRPSDDVDLEALMDDSSSPEQHVLDQEQAQLIERAIARLPEHYRVVFVLRAIEQLSVREVAESLVLDEGTVKTRYFRARAALQAELARQEARALPRVYEFHLERCARVVARVLSQLRQ